MNSVVPHKICCKKTTLEQDVAFKQYLESEVVQTGIYGYHDICHSPGVLMTPPSRTVAPRTDAGLLSSTTNSSSGSTTGTSSTTGTWTSR